MARKSRKALPSVTATLVWLSPVDLKTARTLSRGGVYIVELGGKPVYVGISGDFGRRWRSRLRVLDELRLKGCRFKDYRLRRAVVSSPTTQKSVERVLIRYLLRERRAPLLTNIQSSLPAKVGAGGIAVHSLGSKPSYLPKRIHAKAGTTFEIGPMPYWVHLTRPAVAASGGRAA